MESFSGPDKKTGVFYLSSPGYSRKRGPWKGQRLIAMLLVTMIPMVVLSANSKKDPLDQFQAKFDDRHPSFSNLEKPKRNHPDGQESFVGCPPKPKCKKESDLYRTADGTCNNLKNPLFGSAGIPFVRYLPSEYFDVDQPRQTNPPLPRPRDVSSAMSNSFEGTSRFPITLMVMQWGQFIDHDMVITPTTNISGTPCCRGGSFTPAPTRPECLPLDVTGDPFYEFSNVQCLPFTRSLTVDSNCKKPPGRPSPQIREQINMLTAFLDGSQVYGSSIEQQEAVRDVDGKLKVSTGDEGSCFFPTRCPLSFLPIRPKASSGLPEFFAGDVRVEEQPGLTSIQTLFMRFHNDIATKLKDKYNFDPDWTDERIFQVARSIVGAVIQRITYYDWLKIILGESTIGDYTGYDKTINPSVPNVFATAAFRFGHTLIAETFSNPFVILWHVFNTHTATQSPWNFPSDYIRTLSFDHSAPMDSVLTNSVRNFLFASSPSASFGSDLYSRNIFRGRDHGLPGYNSWRKFCDLPPIENFNDLLNAMGEPAATALDIVYNSEWDNIDLFPAAISESPDTSHNGIVGPTLTCLLKKHFLNLRSGDRFWFESKTSPVPFTQAQLNAIDKTTLSSLACAYANIFFIQRNIFLPEDMLSNPFEECFSAILPGSVPERINVVW